LPVRGRGDTGETLELPREVGLIKVSAVEGERGEGELRVQHPYGAPESRNAAGLLRRHADKFIEEPLEMT
jgi:hypothetical protein